MRSDTAILTTATAILALIHTSARAAPPVLEIASEPLTTACASARFDGPSVLHITPPPANASAADLYQASANMTDWTGHFTRYVISPTANEAPSKPTPAWDAGALLTGDANHAPSPSPAERHIFTSIVEPDGRLATVPFAWSALSTLQRQQLDLPPPPATAPDGLGEQRLAFLRGERTQEGKLFRKRGGVLGDSVHSTPIHVGSAFHAGPASRPSVIYVGANDGMLHAFNAADGRELFAYIPAALFSSLNRLSGPDYVHQAYVDGPASFGEITINNANKTVLVSGMGGGAQGVFALDISDPLRFADHGALWEFTDRDDDMMGNVTTRPQIAKLRTHSVAGVPVHRYFAVVASGLNNYADDGHASPDGKGALFLLALDKPGGAPWQRNVNYFRLVTPIADATLANGLNAPALAADRAGALRHAYAGDLQGNLWRFDFDGDAPWSRSVGPGVGTTPLFVARDAVGKRQPISQQPLLAYADGGGYLVLFGTGKLIGKVDRTPASFAPQTYYAIRDRLEKPAVVVTSRERLTQRTLSGDPDMPLLGMGGARMEADSMGWFVDFLQAQSTGERSIDSGVLVGSELVFNTLLPGLGSCDEARRRTYALNVLTGLADKDSAVTGSPPSDERPIVGQLANLYASVPVLLPVKTSKAPRDPTGRMDLSKEVAVVNVTPQGSEVAGRVKLKLRAGRLSWREVGNWRQLHEAAK